jgi:hypothetical protein
MRTMHLFVAAIAACNAFSPQPTEHAPIMSALSLTKQTNSGEKLSDSSRQTSSSVTSRRGAVSIIATAAVSNFLLTSKEAQAVTQLQSPASAFLGTYSDPINHPGGKRTIQLLGSGDNNSSIGDYTLAQVLGGGGVGEPKEYVLPAVILGDRAIVIDFSPKGGPRDFTGVLEKDGSIRFLRDGNRWPRI